MALPQPPRTASTAERSPDEAAATVSRPRALWRLARGVAHAAHGLLIVLLRFPALDAIGRRTRVRWWSTRMLRLLGIELRVQGAFAQGAKLIVANHVSWVDILAVHAVCPEARFVAKADVQRWPLIGRLVAAGGTLYIERERRRDALRVVRQMQDALLAGDTLAVFPEGTTGDGQALLPFHANVLQAAIGAGAPLQPVALRYADAAHAHSPAALWLGDTTLLGSLWKLASADGLVVHMQVLSLVPGAGGDRRALAAGLRRRIEQALALRQHPLP